MSANSIKESGNTSDELHAMSGNLKTKVTSMRLEINKLLSDMKGVSVYSKEYKIISARVDKLYEGMNRYNDEIIELDGMSFEIMVSDLELI